MFACDSPNSGDYHSPIASTKRDLTPPPCSRLLLHFYGDPTWAPMRKVKKKSIGNIVPIVFLLEKEEEEKEEEFKPETPIGTPNVKEDCLATGDSPEIDTSITKLIEKTLITPATPPPNEKILCRLYGELSNAPSSNRSIPTSRVKIRPRRLYFSD